MWTRDGCYSAAHGTRVTCCPAPCGRHSKNPSRYGSCSPALLTQNHGQQAALREILRAGLCWLAFLNTFVRLESLLWLLSTHVSGTSPARSMARCVTAASRACHLWSVCSHPWCVCVCVGCL